jgi:hypothetical protein
MAILKHKLIKKKKSGFEDMFFIIVVLFAVSIFIIILSKSWGEIKTPLDEGLSASMPANGVNISTTLDQVSSTNTLFDKMIPFLLIGLFGFVLIGASAYLQHPILAFVGIIIVGVAILLGIIYANVYHQISSADEFSSTTAEHPIGDIFMKYLPIWILVAFAGIVTVTIWLRSGGGTTAI